MDGLLYVWRNLWRRKIRSSLCVLGVAISVAMIVALLAITYGFERSLNQYMAESGADAIVIDRDAADLSYSSVTAEEIEGILKLPGVEAISRANFSMVKATMAGGENQPAGMVFLFGRRPEERLIQKYKPALKEGDLLTARGEVMAGAVTARLLGLEVGSEVRLFSKPMAGVERFKVVGIYAAKITWENLGFVVHADIVSEHRNAGDSYSVVFVYGKEGHGGSVIDSINESLPGVNALEPRDFTGAFASQLAGIDQFVAIVTAIALVVGILGVANTLMMSISERTREIGTLRALGWSRPRIARLIVAEGFVLCVVAGVVGSLLGFGGTELLAATLGQGLIVPAYVPDIFVKGGMVALIVGVVGAFYPGWRAGSLRPVEALRYE